MYNVQIRPLDHSDLTDQVTNALMNSCNNELMNFSYSYDAMGNRKQASELSASSGISALSVYSANNLNQYTIISNHVGSLQPTAYSLQPSYDLNGNMTWDGTNAYFWDLQNQLILVSNAEVQVASAYDAMGRRIRKEVDVWDEQLTAYRSQFTSHFYYNGWNLVRETQHSSIPVFHSSTNLYTWGNDLSGSLQGAGGVGGLLAVSTWPTAYCQLPIVSYPLYDHNGNVERYVSRNGATVASFQYDAFGNTVASSLMNSGTNELLNFSFHFQFSTKYWDVETGLYYYGFRFFRPEIGRWVNRDPLEEDGGVNLYGFIHNNGINVSDLYGLFFGSEPDTQFQTINVPKCTAVLYLGHGNKEKPFAWKFPSGECAFGGAVCCYSAYNNPNYFKHRMWPNVPFIPGTMFAGWLATKAHMVKLAADDDLSQDNLENWDTTEKTSQSVFKKGVQSALSAESLNYIVQGLRKCCKTITVIIIVGDGGWEVAEGVQGTGLEPGETFVWTGTVETGESIARIIKK